VPKAGCMIGQLPLATSPKRVSGIIHEVYVQGSVITTITISPLACGLSSLCAEDVSSSSELTGETVTASCPLVSAEGGDMNGERCTCGTGVYL
jgi:hypothetical protein